MMKRLNLPLKKEEIDALNAGDTVYLSGVVLTARDCAHKRIVASLDKGERLPFDICGATIYYAGPCPAKEGMASGSCGPTTSARMQTFAPRLLDLGLNSIIGKGEMNDEVVAAIIRNKAVYFAAIGGAGALYGKNILKSECIAYPQLLSEAVHRLEIKDFPVVVAIDSRGNSVYKK